MEVIVEKECKDCGNLRDIEKFPKNSGAKDGHENICKVCKHDYTSRMWLIKSGKIHNLEPDKKAEMLQWLYLIREKTGEECAEIFKVPLEDIETYLESIDILGKKFCKKCGQLKFFNEFYNAYNKVKGSCTQGKCIECWTERNKEYFQENKQDLMIKNNQWKYDNFNQWIKNRQIWERNKYQTDPLFKLRKNMGTLMYLSLRKGKGRKSWELLVGYSVQELKLHLEAQFDDKMCWDNYGIYWQIDHIVPIESFSILSFEDVNFKNCWSLKNLRPLYGPVNASKSNNIGPEWGNDELAKELLCC